MGMARSENNQEADVWSELEEYLQSELERSRKDSKEIALMLEQSQLEVNKLAQRNASITNHLQQVQGQFDSMPRADIRMAYESALDAQQRLFVMRGQVEKLQSDQNHLNQYVMLIEKALSVLSSGDKLIQSKLGMSTASEIVEQMIQAQEAERQRLSRQMHDGPAQALSNFILQTEIAMRLFDLDQVKAKEELGNIKVSATATFKKVRDFIFELRPMMLDDLGLIPTLKRYIDAFKEQTGSDVRLMVSGTERRLEPYQEVMIFRAIQELLHNASSHSQAEEIKVQVDIGDSIVKVTVDDNGKGFDFENLPERGGMGLKVIRDRTEMVGGAMEVDSVIGHGTRIVFQIPAATIVVQ